MKCKQTYQLFTFIFVVVFGLSACQSTTSQRDVPLAVGPSLAGPSTPSEPKSMTKQYSGIYLDVAVPVFSPGFPINKRNGEIDYDELDEMDIWPQLRRAEAKRFAVETKRAIADTKAFGSVSTVPDANTSADLYVLGTILHSDSEIVRLEVTVVDSTGEPIDSETFEHQVSKSFFRDSMNAGKDPYEPVFNAVADYVYALMIQLPEQRKQQIKDTTLIRYANYYSPEAFGDYLKVSIDKKDGTRFYKYELDGLPAQDDAMLQRVDMLRNQEMLFVDRLQDQFDAFQKRTDDPYRDWQEETLPEVIRAREAEVERNAKAVIGTLGMIAALALGNNSSSTSTSVAKTAGALGSAWLLKDAYKANQNLRVASAVIDEMGQGLDLTVGPQVMEFNDQEIELTGTAAEQYMQWKVHLKKIYQLETSAN